MKKYGNTWEQTNDDPLTYNSWMVAVIKADQIWVDEVAGYIFLREGKYNPIWYRCRI